LRDRALIGLIVYSFARIGAALGMGRTCTEINAYQWGIVAIAEPGDPRIASDMSIGMLAPAVAR